MRTTDWLGIITPTEVEDLRNARVGMRSHPVAWLALADHEQVAVNTDLAARLITDKNAAWLKGMRKRLLDKKDFTAASSALGEIRAYGSLLETWCEVRPGPSVAGSKVSPEFEVDAGDGPVIVEVHSRQLPEDQVRSLDENHAELMAEHAANVASAKVSGRPGNVVTMKEQIVFPTGEPNPEKDDDSVLTNTISRISSIKSNEKQVDPTKPFVLWLDLQDPNVWMFDIDDAQFRPIYTENREGYVGSGGIWFALYGQKWEPMIESRGYGYRRTPMLQDGRFYQTMSHGRPSRVSAVIFSLPRGAILMENPAAERPLPPKFRASMLKIPFFRLDLSVIEWAPGLVKEYVDAQRRMVEAAATALENFDP